MSAIYTWTCFFLWISVATQDKTPDAIVTCFVSEACILPCNFQPSSQVTIEWFWQGAVVYKFERMNDSSSTSKEYFKHEQFTGRATISPPQISTGNATMILRRSGLKDRGTYRCHVQTSEGEHNAKVILKVEAPIQGLFLEQSRLSGYEEMKCTVRDVFPAPRVIWATEPPTFEDLRPITRMMADKRGLYTVDSRLKRMKGQPDLIYICKMTSSYGGPAWTASLREREIKGRQGKDITIPCRVPTYLNNPALQWTFSNGEQFSRVLTYDSHSGRSVSSPPWDSHTELDVFRVPFGDGSLRLMDPKSLEHTGSYTCEFSMPYKIHIERNEVTIQDIYGQQSTTENPSYLWIIGLVVGVVVLALVGILAYLKLRGRTSKLRNDPEEVTELNSVKDTAAAAAAEQ